MRYVIEITEKLRSKRVFPPLLLPPRSFSLSLSLFSHTHTQTHACTHTHRRARACAMYTVRGRKERQGERWASTLTYARWQTCMHPSSSSFISHILGRHNPTCLDFILHSTFQYVSDILLYNMLHLEAQQLPKGLSC